MSERVTGPTVLLVIAKVAIIFVSAKTSGLQCIGVSFSISSETVERFIVGASIDGKVEDAVVVKNVHHSVDVVGVDAKITRIQLILGSSVEFQSRGSDGEQNLVVEGNGVHGQKSDRLLKKVKN